MKLSKRLEAVIGMVTEGSIAADIGCDHAFVPIELVSRGISPFAIASDIRLGPLNKAEEHIKERGLTAKIALSLSDGIPGDIKGMIRQVFPDGKYPLTLITSGMGGLLMCDICRNAGDNFFLFREYIASPQRDADKLRLFLRQNGFLIADEDMIEEDGKFYPVIRAVKTGEDGAGAAHDFEYDYKSASESASESAFESASTFAFASESAFESASTFAFASESVSESVFDSDYDSLCRDLYGPVLLEKRHPVLMKYLLLEEERLGRILAGLEEKSSFYDDDAAAGRCRRAGELKRLAAINERARRMMGMAVSL